MSPITRPLVTKDSDMNGLSANRGWPMVKWEARLFGTIDAIVYTEPPSA